VSVTPIIAAGLFDSPWVLIALVVASGIANWLSKRRAEKNGELPPSDQQPSAPPPVAPPDWEERLRRMLGEDLPPASPPPTAAPPPIIRPVTPPRSAPPLLRPARQPMPPAPPQRPPPVEIVPVIVPQTVKEASAEIEETVRRYELQEAAAKAALHHSIARAPRRATGLKTSLRQPQAARQGFVASLVFGPPKGLES
jgi:hypothetical protein